MTATDLETLRLPSALAEALRAGSRTTVLKQRVAVDFRWWNERLAPRGLPGGPISAPDGRSLTRVDVFAERDNPFRLLWLTLAWGSGNRRRLCEKRIGAVCDTSDVAELLAAATTQAAADPVAAFRILAPGGKPAIKFLGPAFFTKYLYFAAGSDATPPCPLILDSRVATSLHRYGWASLGATGGWPASTYERYLNLIERWRHEASNTLNRTVAGDEIEYWLFAHAAGPHTK